MEVHLDYYRRNEEQLRIQKNGFFRDNHKRGVGIRFLKEGEQIYLLNAGQIAQTFKLDAPTKTKFEHVGPYNICMLFSLP